MLIAAIIILFFISVVVFIYSGLNEVPAHVTRLVVRFGKPVRVLKPGLQWVTPIIEQFYDYSIRTFVLDYKEEQVHTRRKKSSRHGRSESDEFVDEMIFTVDTAVYLTLPKLTEEEMNKSVEETAVARLWERGISPDPYCVLDNSKGSIEALEKFCAPFTLGTQREVAGTMTWKDILYNQNKFVTKVEQELLKAKGKEKVKAEKETDAKETDAKETDAEVRNPYIALGVENLKYKVTKIKLPEEVEKALPLEAVAKNKYEAAVYEAKAEEEHLMAIEKHKEAAAIKAVKQTDKTIFSTDLTDPVNKIFTSNIAKQGGKS